LSENQNIQKKGGRREGAGRKPKIEEIELIERLTPLDDLAFETLKKGLQSRNCYPFLKTFMEYRYGKPKETKAIDLTSGGQPFSLKDLLSFDDNTKPEI
jgi:hypothetical protein